MTTNVPAPCLAAFAVALASPMVADDSLADNGTDSCADASSSALAQCVADSSTQSGDGE